jgi:hypothetical protein
MTRKRDTLKKVTLSRVICVLMFFVDSLGICHNPVNKKSIRIMVGDLAGVDKFKKHYPLTT